jgi:hypothetical protein
MRWPGRTRNPSPLEQGLNSKCGGHSQSDRTPNARHVCRAFDGLALPRLTLLGGGAARGFERLRMRGEAFRERAVDDVGPAVLVADQLVSDVCHRLRGPKTFAAKNHRRASPVLPSNKSKQGPDQIAR